MSAPRSRTAGSSPSTDPCEEMLWRVVEAWDAQALAEMAGSEQERTSARWRMLAAIERARHALREKKA